ncbi:MAG: TIGR00730 family Rossman fold protein [candidate division KSB1 bacterium]|nr:TIGR00730 family Rossman fold protein [candidate division KSB1 bacterium]MDZ7275890.1 TIGR00730 family Rossman fold protein [candidate division KSB1 bacterium]MDZ7287640.1 TIGR00730 family Rossman fold protein [candidate division KSB1 bacterium]MDZ7306802.1 TIGR00730 family Rossman fold protein [candidate division KSB1 bacterium]MDZ7350618.1 TIGR00730 family Rossman fold protein [candidate division KSB1 bacterium]
MQRVCVYCASSSQCDPFYFEQTRRLGGLLAHHGVTIVFGGGSTGLMGALADSALAAGGKVIGVLPQFMQEVEWGHTGLTELHITDDMHQRKRLMIEKSQGLIALPGGSGTLEELFEAITWKRLGLHTHPIVIVNLRGFFDPALELLERCIRERFMRPQHRLLWSVVDSVDGVLAALNHAAPWDRNAIRDARV